MQGKNKLQDLVAINEDEELDDDDEFLKGIGLNDPNDPFDQDFSVEPSMERRLSEKPVMQKADSYEYKMTELEFPNEDEVDEEEVKKEEQKLQEQKQIEDAA